MNENIENMKEENNDLIFKIFNGSSLIFVGFLVSLIAIMIVISK